MSSKHDYCRVCGLYNKEKPWGEDGDTPTYEICSCCSVTFGYQDYTIEAIKEFRGEWIRKGMPWFDPKLKPKEWDWKEQFKNIPDIYK